jgi:iron complex transport system permease protein
MRKSFIAPALLLFASVIGLAFGTSNVAGVWQIIFNPFTDTGSLSHQIVWELRGTRIAAAILVGASLGIAGTLAQGSTNNPLAEPTILGTSAGAALGVLLGVLSNLVEIGSVGAVLFAACGALLVTTLVFSLAHSALSLITVGIGVSAIVSALVGLTLTAVNRPDARSISFWTFGSFALVTPSDLLILAPVLVLGALAAWKLAPRLDLLSLGDAAVRHIGQRPQRIRYQSFIVLSILVAASVSLVGIISFLALAAPHIARYLFGPSNRSVVFNSAIVGALILLVADIASRSVVPPYELPIGLLTSLIGAPILIATLKRGKDVWR